VAATAAAGWVLPFAAGSGHGDPGGRLAHAVGALTGLPDGSASVAALTMLIAVIQGLAGYWLAGAITPRLHPDRTR
jgi:hypothetical protein